VSRDTLLLVTTSFPQSGDGSEAAGGFVADLARSLHAHFPVRVVAPGGRELVEQLPGGIQVYRFASPGRPLSLLSAGSPADWPAIISTLRSLRRQTLKAAQDGEVAHTLALWALPSGWAARELQRSSGIPYSVWALGSDIWSMAKVPVVRTILRNVIRGAVCRFADGLQLGADAEVISGMPFEFLPSSRRLGAVRVRPIAKAPPYRLLFLGRWHPNKGVDLLLEALSMLDDATWERISLVHIAGGGPMAACVRDRVAALLSAGRPLKLDGFLDGVAACCALDAADYLLIPSRIESIPVVFSDALKMTLPVVSMPVGDLPELVTNAPACGVLATSVSALAFAQAISRAVRVEPVSFLQGIADRQAAFDLDQVALRLVASTRAVTHA